MFELDTQDARNTYPEKFCSDWYSNLLYSTDLFGIGILGNENSVSFFHHYGTVQYGTYTTRIIIYFYYCIIF